MESTLAPDRSVILGSFAFVLFWVTATFPKFFGLPIGRTAGAIVGATLMVIFQVSSPDEAYASINLPILGLLFGTMVVSVYLQRADMFKYLASALTYHCRGGRDLICRLSFLVAFTSALFTNDTCCVLLTEFILALCKEKELPPEPFLLALASSANLGSSATPIGNPQNLVIAIQSKISFGRFLMGIFPAMLVGVTLNLCLLLAMYWNELSGISVQHKSKMKLLSLPNLSKVEAQSQQPIYDVEEVKGHATQPSPLDELTICKGSQIPYSNSANSSSHASQAIDFNASHNQGNPLTESSIIGNKQPEKTKESFMKDNNIEPQLEGSQGFSHVVCMVVEPQVDMQHCKAIEATTTSFLGSSCQFSLAFSKDKAKVWRGRLWRLSVYFVTIGMLAALLAGLDLSWCTITAAIALIVLDFEDAGPSLGKVSYSLLVFFSGMFITVDGFNRTGLPTKFWSVVEPHARINHASGTTVLTAVVILLSNIASNVPTVLLLGPKVAASSAAIHGVSVARAWLILAWASTVAGNLTLVGSAANLIVCEQARTAGTMPYSLSFWRHLKFGFPSTLLTVAIGLPLLRA